MSAPSCKDCRFFVQPHCRRFPPTRIAFLKNGTALSDFPTTLPTAWCGEFKSKIRVLDLDAINNLAQIRPCGFCGSTSENHHGDCPHT